jgi:ATP-binding cassette subfamily B protein
MGARSPKATAAERVAHPERRSLRERFGGLRNIPPFLRLVWHTSPSMMLAQSLLRLIRALLPVATLYVGKLIIDEVVALARTPHPVDDLREWFDNGWLDPILWLLGLEFILAVVSDVLGRTVSLLDSLLSERFSNATSLRLRSTSRISRTASCRTASSERAGKRPGGCLCSASCSARRRTSSRSQASRPASSSTRPG